MRIVDYLAYFEPLDKTVTHGVAGEPEWRQFPAGIYPSCSLHGAMLRVSKEMPWYRCSTCNIGVAVVMYHELVKEFV